MVQGPGFPEEGTERAVSWRHCRDQRGGSRRKSSARNPLATSGTVINYPSTPLLDTVQ